MDKPQVWLTPTQVKEVQRLIDQYRAHTSQAAVFDVPWENASDLTRMRPFEFSLSYSDKHLSLMAVDAVMDEDIYNRLTEIFRALHNRMTQQLVAKLEQYGVDIEGRYTDTK